MVHERRGPVPQRQASRPHLLAQIHFFAVDEVALVEAGLHEQQRLT